MYLLNMNKKDYRHFIKFFYLSKLNDEAQLYLILQPLYYTLKRLGDTEKVVSWKPKGFLNKKLSPRSTTDNIFYKSIKWYGNSTFCVIFKGSCLKQGNATFTHSNRINFYCL